MSIRNVEDLHLEDITEEVLIEESIELAERLGVDSRQGSVYRDATDGAIIRAAKFFDDLRNVYEIFSINTCTGDVLDERLAERGLTRNPEAATSAAYYVEFVGAEPVIGERASCDEHFFTFTKDKTGAWIMISDETGSEMNTLPVGLPVIPEVDVDELISATLVGLAVPAVDAEDDETARERLLNAIKTPAVNGNQEQIRQFCEEVEGVGRCRLIVTESPTSGFPIVDAYIVSSDGGVPTEDLVKRVQDYMDPGSNGLGLGRAPIGCRIHVHPVEPVYFDVSGLMEVIENYNYMTVTEDIRQAIIAYIKNRNLVPFTDMYIFSDAAATSLMMNVDGVLDVDLIKVRDINHGGYARAYAKNVLVLRELHLTDELETDAPIAPVG